MYLKVHFALFFVHFVQLKAFMLIQIKQTNALSLQSAAPVQTKGQRKEMG